MNTSYQTITITRDNYTDYDFLDVVAISIASGGAMGDPGAIVIITSKGKVFYANPSYESISLEQLLSICPILLEIDSKFSERIKNPIGWEYIYLGWGNHLYIKESIYAPFQIGMKQKEEQIKESLLYNNWKEIVLDCLDGTIYMNERIDKLKGVIFGQAIGDALGLGTEFMDDAEMAQKCPNGVSDYSDIYQDAHRSRWKVGEWTDDTDMMLCIANALVKDKGVDLSHIARNFKQWAEGEPMGIGQHTYKVLTIGDYVDKPQDVSKLVWEMSRGKSAANGGLMRTSIVGALPKEVEKAAANICRLTHYDPRCVGSCVIVSELIHSLIYDSQPITYQQMIEIADRYDERIKRYISLSREADIKALELQDEQSMGYTLKTLSVALWAYWNASSFKEGLLAVVNAGGDADTNAAVACAILGAKYGYSAIPQEYIDGLLHKNELDIIVDGISNYLGLQMTVGL